MKDEIDFNSNIKLNLNTGRIFIFDLLRHDFLLLKNSGIGEYQINETQNTEWIVIGKVYIFKKRK